ncbi:sulfotransferase family 2 domain-containing protein [Cognatishimia sp. F0-27]|uniref:sulfotransferase family 2 domain-containing protein n=1 Tax=Cognatishimia sp. F0-27 TaxID=2816855 RepID=UPI001D0C57EA|nr:sulfotransferase family 2 domain-containing protein [Cognatishimia sp. F0-27]MCC1491895.1 sulfotransferase family 2 domain-containing protein [Cognatishimia sp. F0-27]
MAIVIEAYRIAYMALPKAACSSVKLALAGIDPAAPRGFADGRGGHDVHNVHGLYQTRRFRPHRWAAYEDHFRFCVIRDPVERLLAVYTNRVCEIGELKMSRRLRRHAPELPTDPDPDTFFRNLDRYKALASSIKHHALGAWAFVGPELGPARYNRVYRIEELDALAWDLGLLSRRSVEIPRANRSRARLQLEALSGSAIDAIRPFLDREYAHLGAFYDNPLGSKMHASCAIGSACVS